jgi:hypothetical protein
MIKYPSFDKMIIQYDTGPLPPPFCHRYTIEVSKSSGKYSASLNLEYYDRDEVSQEEIVDEGFSMDDDYQWNGELPEIWIKTLQHKIDTSNWMKKPKTEAQMSHMEIRISTKGRSELIYPTEQRVWEVFAQEFIQAIFEISDKEAPLKIEFAHVGKNKSKDLLSLVFRFSVRSVEIHSPKNKSFQISWSEGQKMMKYIYFFDYMPEDGLVKLTGKPGYYLQPGNNLWYDLKGDTLSEDDGRKQKLIDTLKTYF